MQSADEVVGPVNIGNPGEYTILELAEMVMKLIGGRSKIVFKPLPQDDPTQRQPDITVARSTLGWEPKVPLQEGLERTIAYFKTLLHTDNGA
jgi:UDP-glucuronate decarboxylase